MKNVSKKIFIIIFQLAILFRAISFLFAVDSHYMTPSQSIIDIVDKPFRPSIRVSPDANWLLLLERPRFPLIKELSQPELELAGLRIDPETNGPSRSTYYLDMKLVSTYDGRELRFKSLPEIKIEDVSWSPDSKKIAFTVIRRSGLELWVAFIETKKLKRLTEAIINDAYYGPALKWMPDSKCILYKSILKDRGRVPEREDQEISPVIQQNEGKVVAVRTYQSLLKDKHDERLFKYYMTAQLKLIDLDGKSKKIGSPEIVKRFSPSPDGKYILVEFNKPPFSYLLPGYRFPTSIEIWNSEGKKLSTLADIPLMDDIPQVHGSCRKGSRSFTWSSNEPATIFWVEAQDKGDPRITSEYRDKLFCLQSPFQDNQKPKEVLSLKLRYGRIDWGNDTLAIIYQYWRKDRREIVAYFNPTKEKTEAHILFDRNYEDIYNDPGNFVKTYNKDGKRLLSFGVNSNILYLSGRGASPEGNHPFLSKFNLKTKKATRLWQSSPPFYERFVGFIDRKKDEILITRESKTIQPNYYLYSITNHKLTQLTYFPHPHKHLNEITKKLIRYERDDGVKLTATLYLPPNYEKENDGPLPVFMKAYPQEFKSADAASQVSESPYRFSRIYQWSPQLWVTKGFAVLDDAAMPIIGEGEHKPNDSYVEQLVENAKSAVNKIAKMGIGDSERVVIDGHSYGAFMVANLLAHSDIFTCGIARSGAYNRTLTPFGFQHEDRTYWEAPKVYLKMSPFMHADKINEPILLIHGKKDNNSGTYPMQSERFYHALKGNGVTTRLVLLPYESHGYKARESVMHVLWEIERWLDKYVINNRSKEDS